MDYKHIYYPESRFGGFTDIDGTIVFYSRVNALLDETCIVLDFGCGRGTYYKDPIHFRRNLRILRGKVKKVIGLDIDEQASTNPYIDEFMTLKSTKWDIADETVDMCVADNVIEHLREPEIFFSECARVLKTGGHLCIRAPNAFSYIAIASRIVPNRLHAKILSRIQAGREECDVFPTYYRCNTIGKLDQMMGKYGFSSVVYGYEAEPSYLGFSRAAYFLGYLHQKVSPSRLHAAIFAFGRRTRQ